MVPSTTEWCNLPPPKVIIPKEKKAAAKSDHEPKGTGTRRIFSPVFKLQVLDSYRQDADCQGNQRATARKYGIHRRQIQKWLQMETKLRLSVHKSTSALNLSSAVPQLDANRSAEPGLPSGSSSPALMESQFSSSGNSDSDEYVNVDEISDSEDDGTSSSLSYESCDKALDFTCTTLGKHSCSDDLKRHVLRTSSHEGGCHNHQTGTALKSGIHRHQVQKWVNQEVAASCVPSEASIRPSPLGTCLDLSSTKRKLGDTDDLLGKPAKRLLTDEVQESALCLVKHCDEPAKKELIHENHQLSHHQHILYPAATSLEHSYGNLKPEYPIGMYQPWGCCYPRVLSAKSGLGTASTLGTTGAYSYAFNVKYEASYVDIPVQYGFGDSVPCKWLKQNPLFLHSLPSLYPCL